MNVGEWKSDYREYLSILKERNVSKDLSATEQGFSDIVLGSVFHQPNAMKNDEIFPIVATRKDIRKCKLDLLPGTEACVGDVFYVYDEYWLCVEMYKDEYGMFHGEAWLCNHIFKFTNKNGRIIKVRGVLDDGSYSDPKDSKIPVENNSHICYVPESELTKPLRLDKRIAIGVIEDEDGEKILEVGVISWVDRHSRNIGEGSHLLTFGITSGVFDKSADSIVDVVCDFNHQPNRNGTGSSALKIEGSRSIRIGTTRTYKAKRNGVISDGNVVWSTEGDMLDEITFDESDGEFSISVPLDENLVGSKIILNCRDESNSSVMNSIEIEVIPIG